VTKREGGPARWNNTSIKKDFSIAGTRIQGKKVKNGEGGTAYGQPWFRRKVGGKSHYDTQNKQNLMPFKATDSERGFAKGKGGKKNRMWEGQR